MIGHDRDMDAESVASGSWKGEDVQYVKDHVIVHFSSDRFTRNAVDEVASLAKDLMQDFEKLTLVRRPSRTGRALFRITDGRDPIALARRLAARPEIADAEPDFIDHIAIAPNDPRLNDQAHLFRVHAPVAWTQETGDTAVLIGIIDSGISMAAAAGGGLNHPDLNAARYTLGTDFVDGGTPRDLHGHGTHVTGIAAAETNNGTGVAGADWSSRVYITRVFDAAGNGTQARLADAIEETVDFADDNNLRAVLNYSGSGPASTTKRNACQYIDDHGMLFCAATGNNGPTVGFPGAYSGVFPNSLIAVGSTDLDDTVSSFSNTGPETTVVGPGRDILSTMPTYAVTLGGTLTYGVLSGTSMATPLVTGLCALIWAQNPSWSNNDVRNQLIQTVKKLGPVAFSNDWGNGRVDFARALRGSSWLEPILHTMFS